MDTVEEVRGRLDRDFLVRLKKYQDYEEVATIVEGEVEKYQAILEVIEENRFWAFLLFPIRLCIVWKIQALLNESLIIRVEGIMTLGGLKK